MSRIKLRIGIIGAGSIGSLFGGYLAKINSDKYILEIVLFSRKSHVEAISHNGLIINSDDEISKIRNIKAYDNLDSYIELSDNDFDFLFLTTKCYDIESALVQYKSLINECKRFVVLQNGLGNEEVIKKICPAGKIIRAVTSNGGILKEPGKIIHIGKGITKLGFPFIENLKLKDNNFEEAYKDLKCICEILNISGLETKIVKDIKKEIWEKVFVNIGINSFGALTRLTNGQLLMNERLKFLMGRAVKEAIEVAQLKKINLSKKDYVAIMYSVAEKTSGNKNSMLQDILKGKKTEIDYINGRIVKYAYELNLNVPINETLTYLIKGLESSLN